MKQKVSIFLIALFFLFFPFVNIILSSSQLKTEAQRESFLSRYRRIEREARDLRWMLKKIELKEKLNAQSYLVVDMESNSPLLSKNENAWYPIASITKLMSSLVAVEHIDPRETITLSHDMLVGYNQRSPALLPGYRVSAENLIKASLIQSTNDASEALTYFMGEGSLVLLMNKKAKEIGMEKARFYDAHGLAGISSLQSKFPNPNISTANDLVKLISYIHENHPKILEATTKENFQLPGNCPQHGGICTFRNTNIGHKVEEFVGGKGGYLGIAKQTYTGVFDFNGRKYIMVLLYSDNRNSDIQNISNWLRERP